MRFLSFDTSSQNLHLSLNEDNNVVWAKVISAVAANRQETATILLPSIDMALKEADWKKHELTHIVAGVGPGSFTGLRVTIPSSAFPCLILLLRESLMGRQLLFWQPVKTRCIWQPIMPRKRLFYGRLMSQSTSLMKGSASKKLVKIATCMQMSK